MKKLVFRSVALIVIGVSIVAQAADMAGSGLYVGGNFGGAWTSGNLNIPGNNFYGGVTEFIAGVQETRQMGRRSSWP